MQVTVSMSPDEFVEYLAYRDDKQKFLREADLARRDKKLFSDRLKEAVAPDPKKPGRYKIVDQEYMEDLFILAFGVQEAVP